jgi:hypothetical protein
MGGPRELVNNNQTKYLVGFLYKGQTGFGDLRTYDHINQMITLTVITLSGGFHYNIYFKMLSYSKLFLKKDKKGLMKASA